MLLCDDKVEYEMFAKSIGGRQLNKVIDIAEQNERRKKDEKKNLSFHPSDLVSVDINDPY